MSGLKHCGIYIYNRILLNYKYRFNCAFATIWLKLEDFMLNKIIQKQKNNLNSTYMWNTMKKIKQKEMQELYNAEVNWREKMNRNRCKGMKLQ